MFTILLMIINAHVFMMTIDVHAGTVEALKSGCAAILLNTGGPPITLFFGPQAKNHVRGKNRVIGGVLSTIY